MDARALPCPAMTNKIQVSGGQVAASGGFIISSPSLPIGSAPALDAQGVSQCTSLFRSDVLLGRFLGITTASATYLVRLRCLQMNVLPQTRRMASRMISAGNIFGSRRLAPRTESVNQLLSNSITVLTYFGIG